MNDDNDWCRGYEQGCKEANQQIKILTDALEELYVDLLTQLRVNPPAKSKDHTTLKLWIVVTKDALAASKELSGESHE